MNGPGRMSSVLHKAYREDDWRGADELRRARERPDAETLDVRETVWRRPLVTLRRLIPRHG